eukprot:2670907-Lingulodinium_polyedra.AAC.1
MARPARLASTATPSHSRTALGSSASSCHTSFPPRLAPLGFHRLRGFGGNGQLGLINWPCHAN